MDQMAVYNIKTVACRDELFLRSWRRPKEYKSNYWTYFCQGVKNKNQMNADLALRLEESADRAGKLISTERWRNALLV